jgi:hypothetical protein
LFPFPEAANRFYLRLHRKCCSISYIKADDPDTLTNNPQIPTKKLAILVKNLKFYLYVSNTLFEAVKLLLFLTALYFIYLGFFSSVYFNLIEGVLDIGCCFLLTICVRGTGYIFLQYLHRLERKFNEKFVINSQHERIIVGKKCFWIEVDVMDSLLEVNLT